MKSQLSPSGWGRKSRKWGKWGSAGIMMIMPNYCLWISLIRPRKLDTCAPQHIITKWPECIGEKCRIQNAQLQLTLYRGPLQDLPYCTWPILKIERQIFHPTLKQLKTSEDYLKWFIENEIHNHNHQAWFENLNQTSPWPLPVAIIAANEQFVGGAGIGMGQGKLYGRKQ